MEISSPINSPGNSAELRSMLGDKPSDVLDNLEMEATKRGCQNLPTTLGCDFENWEISASTPTDMGDWHGSSLGTNLGNSCPHNLENQFQGY